MKAEEIRHLTADQLDEQLGKLKKEQFNLRFQKATGQRLAMKEVALYTVKGDKVVEERFFGVPM